MNEFPGEDPDLDRIQRREAARRLEGLLNAVNAPRDEAHAREAFRHAHTLAGLSDDRGVVLAARRLTRIYSDPRGNVHVPDASEGAEAARLVRELALKLSLL